MLVIGRAGSDAGEAPIAARVRTPDLRRLAVSGDGEVEIDLGDAPRERLELVVDGAGRVSVRGVDAKLLRVDIEGTAEVRILGRAARLEVAADGAGNLDLEGLCATADLALDGAGRTTVIATVRLDARVGGSGVLRYFAPHELPAPAGDGAVRRPRTRAPAAAETRGVSLFGDQEPVCRRSAGQLEEAGREGGLEGLAVEGRPQHGAGAELDAGDDPVEIPGGHHRPAAARGPATRDERAGSRSGR